MDGWSSSCCHTNPTPHTFSSQYWAAVPWQGKGAWHCQYTSTYVGWWCPIASFQLKNCILFNFSPIILFFNLIYTYQWLLLVQQSLIMSQSTLSVHTAHGPHTHTHTHICITSCSCCSVLCNAHCYMVSLLIFFVGMTTVVKPLIMCYK